MKTTLPSKKIANASRCSVGFYGAWLVLIAFGLLSIGCTSDITIDPGTFKSKLVVNAHITPDRYFEVEVKASVTALSPDQSEIPDGVEVMITDITKDAVLKLFREDSTWIAPMSYPKAGHEYMLKVTAPGYDPVSAYTMIPEDLGEVDLVIRDYTLIPSPSTPQKNNLTYTLDLDLRTAMMSTGYLHVIFTQSSELNVGSINNPDIQQIEYSVIPEFPEESGYVVHIQDGVMIDVSRLNDPQSLSFTFRDYTLGQFEQIGDLSVEIRQVTEDYYDYFVSLKRQMLSREDPFAEPIQAFTNIESGLGCFSSFHSNTVVISFPE